MRARFVLGFLFLAPVASAQVTMNVTQGNSSGDWFGWELGALGDVNDDGFPDLVASAPHDPTGTGAGSVSAISGLDGSLLYTIHGAPPSSTDPFGWSVAGIGDVNADGIGDFAVGFPDDSTVSFRNGSVRVCSGLDGSELYTVHNVSGTGYYGYDVSGAGDVDGDGVPDVIAGTVLDYTNAGQAGMAEVFSGVDGTILHTWFGLESFGKFGSAVGAAGDVNNDGRDDLIVGAHSEGAGTQTGRAYVFSGMDGSLLHTWDGTMPYSLFGSAVDGLGDVNDDGHDDVAVGAAQGDYLRVFSGATGAMLYEIALADTGPTWGFGTALSGRGDLNDDGERDLLVSSPQEGLAYGYSGIDGTQLFSVSAAMGELGDDVEFTGPISGTSVVGFAASAFWSAPGGLGLVQQYATDCFWRAYCVTTPNSVGPGANIAVRGSLSIADNSTRLEAYGCPPDQFAIFIYSRRRDFVPLSDGTLCVGGHIYRLPVFSTGPNGTPSFLIDFDDLPPLGGQIVTGEGYRFQCWYRDLAGGPAGANLSDAAEVWFCP